MLKATFCMLFGSWALQYGSSDSGICQLIRAVGSVHLISVRGPRGVHGPVQSSPVQSSLESSSESSPKSLFVAGMWLVSGA